MNQDHVDLIQSQWTKEMPHLDTTPMGVIGRLSRISRHIDQYLQLNYSNFGLNGGEFDVLASLRRSGEPYQLTPTQLFNSLMLSSAAMTNRLDRLENADLIKRQPNPNDRRGVLVTLTTKGLALMDEAYPAHISHEKKMLAALSEREQAELMLLLRKLLISFEAPD